MGDWASASTSVQTEQPAIAALNALITCGLFHLLSEAERAHIGPDFFDVIEAFLLGAGLTDRAPAEWDFAALRPYRILLFVVDDDRVNSRVFAIRILPA